MPSVEADPLAGRTAPMHGCWPAPTGSRCGSQHANAGTSRCRRSGPAWPGACAPRVPHSGGGRAQAGSSGWSMWPTGRSRSQPSGRKPITDEAAFVGPHRATDLLLEQARNSPTGDPTLAGEASRRNSRSARDRVCEARCRPCDQLPSEERGLGLDDARAARGQVPGSIATPRYRAVPFSSPLWLTENSSSASAGQKRRPEPPPTWRNSRPLCSHNVAITAAGSACRLRSNAYSNASERLEVRQPRRSA